MLTHRFSRLSQLFAALCLCLGATAADAIKFTGVNLSGAEFGEGSLPGVYNTHYTYPTTAEADYFTGKGMNALRVPFRWERLQRSINGALDATELGRLRTFVNYATGKGAHVILDPHNYARYRNNVIGSAALPQAAFNDFWTRVANEFRTNDHVIFGLMNEPHTMPTETWRDAANSAIAAIRATGATNLILVPGNAWTGAHSWLQNWYGTPNGTAMRSITDPANNYVFDVHQYLDDDSSGTDPDCASAAIGVDRLRAFTTWCRSNGRKAFLGEFGVSTNSTCLTAMTNMLAFVHANTDVWIGWTWWAAGPWWGNYMFSLEPQNGRDRRQMDFLEPYIPVAQPTLRMENPAAFTFSGKPGYIYQPEATSPPSFGNWTAYGLAITGGAATITVPTRASVNAAEFYRVRTNRSP